MASSSSSPQEKSIASPKLYDAFISHRGPDVKHTLAKQLYERLKATGCTAFLDREEIKGGDSIPFAISNGICSSLVQIAIFSKGYATSSWCLDELVLMLEQKDALFVPVFYDVKPWELRHIENKESQYAAAFSYYRSKHRNLDKLEEWKKALVSASNISGYELSEHQDNLQCENIVSRVLQEVQEKKNKILLDVAKYPVGLAELVQDFESFCSKTVKDKVKKVGIFGLGGSGKTTLAKEFFNRKSSGYHASCFLSDVRESHARGELHCMQAQLLQDLLPQELKFTNVHHGIRKLKDCLGRARHLHFLIILDDIDHEDQLDALLPEGMLSFGSLVIITTRDQSVLRGADIRYKMKVMNSDLAKDLFCSHAFRGRDVPIAYEKLVESFVEFCGGLPLSLKVLGAHVYDRDEYYWELELGKVKNIQPKDIMQRLKISFDALDSQEKQIFIDIACFFNKWKDIKRKAMSFWNVSGWSAEHAVQTLQDKCLLEVVDYYFDKFEMHDHLRDLGRQMAEDWGPPRLWKPELLRLMEANGFKQILAETKARCFHIFWDLSLKTEITYFIGGLNDSAETELLWLEMKGGFSKSIPSWIPLRKLRCLRVWDMENLWSTFREQLQSNTQVSFELTKLKISITPSLQNLPGLIGKLNHLEELEIVHSLEKTDITSLLQSLQQLNNLRLLHLSGLGGNLNLSKGNFEALTSSRMNSLESMRISSAVNISKLLISGEMCPKLRSLEINYMFNLNEMDLQRLETLNTLSVMGCHKLGTISGLSSLTGLQALKVEGCLKLKTISGLSSLTGLQSLRVWDCSELKTISGLEELPGLKSLIIQAARYGCPSRLPSEYTILVGKAEWSRLNVNLFSEVIGAQAVAEIKYMEKMRSSSSAITIYVLHVSTNYDSLIKGMHLLPIGEWMVTCLVTEYSSDFSLRNVKIQKGFMVTVNKNEEKKAINVLKIIVDRLYGGSVIKRHMAR